MLQTAAAAEQHRLATAAAELSQQATAVLAELSAAHGSKQELAVMTLSYSSSVLAALKAFAGVGALHSLPQSTCSTATLTALSCYASSGLSSDSCSEDSCPLCVSLPTHPEA